MFFRRERPKKPTFQERLDSLGSRGFEVARLPNGAFRVTRNGCAVDIRDKNGDIAWDAQAGILIGSEVAPLVDGGYQKFFRGPSGVRKPALAPELAALHNFEEDLKEALGQQVLYNEALGTVSTFYQYDRVQDRDRGVPKRAWE
ncbi:MAG TPA: hypothetical protein VMH28_23285 [Candidatus Acidoferrales bacterium]|nr:hypothetical protein [Candidatus Acidoferrales bacterium]